jgi:3D (Asp-Asp-Asp) domain-containing protein
MDRLPFVKYATLMTDAVQHIIVGTALLLVGCAMNAKSTKTSQPTDPNHLHERRVVKTTAYTAGESSRRSAKNAVGSPLRSGEINSAAADWSHFPIGTKFRVAENNKTYVVDDYGPALVGTDTIDLYVSSDETMNRWGKRRVTIEILEKGSYERSLELLEPRRGNWCCRQMAKNIEKQIGMTY